MVRGIEQTEERRYKSVFGQILYQLIVDVHEYLVEPGVESQGNVVSLPPNTTADELATALNALGVEPRDLISIFQAATQVNEQTLTFVPKIVAMVMALSLCLPWLVQKMLEYSEEVIMNIPNVIMGG